MPPNVGIAAAVEELLDPALYKVRPPPGLSDSSDEAAKK